MSDLSATRSSADALALVRADLVGFAGYASARRATGNGRVWLNANESADESPADTVGGLNRYPEPQPLELCRRLAELHGVDSAQLAVTRGSDEGIDLLVRAFCRARQDAVLVAPPTFGMYAVCARLQEAPLVEIPLLPSAQTWQLDTDGILDAVATRAVRLVFLCSPANPTGQAIALAQVRELAGKLHGKAIVVIDEAYAEYSSTDSALSLVNEFPCLVVLRTLSKAHALAGARIGVVVANAAVISVLRNLSAPYPLAAPCAQIALAAMQDDVLLRSVQRCAETIRERDALAATLRGMDGVRCVYRSDANFLLVRFDDAGAVFERLLDSGIVVRDMRAIPGLGDALRISIGSPTENALVHQALAVGACA